MKIKAVPFSWITRWGLRLDCGPYMSGAVDARIKMESPHLRSQPLIDVTKGIFHAGRESRMWVTDPKHGVPFLSSSDILKADHTDLSLLSRKQVQRNPGFLIQKGSTLITRSGTIGRMVYVRSNMDGMACSEHAMRVVPDERKIPPGYLHAFLRCRFGVPMVIGGTYGSIIQSIEPQHIADLPVPRSGDAIERKAHELVEKAAYNRSRAAELRRESRTHLTSLLRLPDMSASRTPLSFATFAIRSGNLNRLDAAYHSPPGAQAAKALAQYDSAEYLDTVATVFQTNIFKRPYVEDLQYGYAYYSDAELFTYDPQPRGYLRKKAPGIEDYIVRTDWLLMQDAGQLGGLIGQVMRVTKQQDMSVVSNHLIRIYAKSRRDSAYLYALLSSPIGYRAVVRNAFGSSIPQLESTHIRQIMVPWPMSSIRQCIANPILNSWELEDAATDFDHEAVALVENAIEEAA
ncbi:MAG: methylation-associated defense system restriction endonuclease subunit S MAD5 [Gemmataceae bacterium]